MKLHPVIVALMLLVAVPALAQEELHPIDQQLNQCLDEAVNNDQMTQCAMDAYRAWDEEVSAQFKALMEALPDGLAAKLEASQVAWIEYRKQEFEFNNDFFSGLEGSSWNVSSADWKMSFTRNRALELQTYNDIIKDADN